MKGTHEHSEGYLKRFDNKRCLCQSEESMDMDMSIVPWKSAAAWAATKKFLY